MIKKIFVLFLAVITIMLSSVSGAVFAEGNEPDVYGKAAILMDMDTGRILFGKNIDEKKHNENHDGNAGFGKVRRRAWQNSCCKRYC